MARECYQGQQQPPQKVIESLKQELAEQQRKEKALRLTRRQGLEDIRYLRSEQKALVQQLAVLKEQQRLASHLENMREFLRISRAGP
jgi:uncharacterized protein YicC (UPF0701 family)